MKPLYIASLVAAILSPIITVSTNAHAVDSSWLPGECRPLNGTKSYTFNFLKTVNDISENEKSKEYPNAFQWSDNTQYNIQCNCMGSSTPPNPHVYFKTVTNLKLHTTINNKNFYKVSDNLAVASRSYISGKGDINVPFSDYTNTGAPPNICSDQSAKSGSDGNLDLLITSPFIGQMPIPNTNIFNLYASVVPGSYGLVPIAQVNITGLVTVQQSCEINAGQSIQVDFGEMMNGNFKGRGSKPQGVSAKTLQLGYKCYLVSNGMDVKMRFTGQNDSNYPDALATTNPDIGVIIEDGNGNPVQPNTGTIPMTVDYDSQKGSVDITTYPVSTTGKIPVVGQFTSRATVVVDFQ